MVTYRCIKCDYITGRKSDFIKHKQRKIPCSINTMKGVENNDEYEVNHFESFSNHFESLNTSLPKQTEECMYCGSKFSLKTNLTRHLKNNCIVLKCQMNKKKDDEISELKAEVKKLHDELVSKPQNIITNINKGQISNNSNNKISNKTITINSYGNESIDHLSSEYFKDLISLPYTAVQKLIKDIHCNPHVPENHNLRKRNKKDKFIEYYDGKKWKVEDKKKKLDHLVDMTFTILENIVDIEDDIDNKHLERFSIFRDKYYEDRDNIKTNDINEAEIMIMNHSK